MEQQNNLPDLDYVIAKIKRQEELTPEEELIYLVHLEKIPEADAIELVLKWSGKNVKRNNYQQQP